MVWRVKEWAAPTLNSLVQWVSSAAYAINTLLGHEDWVRLGSYTISSATNQDITAEFDNDIYSAYRIEIRDFSPAADSTLQVLKDANGGASFDTSGYQHHERQYRVDADAAAVNRAASGTEFPIAIGQGSAAGEELSGVLYIYDAPNNARMSSECLYTDGAGVFEATLGWCGVSTAINAIRFQYSSGTNIAAGSLVISGKKT